MTLRALPTTLFQATSLLEMTGTERFQAPRLVFLLIPVFLPVDHDLTTTA